MRRFTLIELMIVFAIIALLLSILYPSLSKAREQSRRALCKSNSQQIAQIINFYSGIYNGRISLGVDNSNYQASYMFNATESSNAYSYLSYFKADLIGAPEVWYCPSNKSEFFQYKGSINMWPPLNGKTKTRAAYSSRPLLEGADSPQFPSISSLESTQAVLTDIISRRGLYDEHHAAGSNVLFLDGSAGWAKLELIENLLNTMSRYHDTGSNTNFLRMFHKLDSMRK
ncbi:MAG: prepilin-type N-terminal cleavage/methylation domain-containing protein [Lentisphaeraceae bacterium]|nr:prepilin-type N-terminal cleavage/methylation domain-containing protein [Lentisphaeraceae bacterium]